MAVCATCQDPLVLSLDASSDDDDEDVLMGASSSAPKGRTTVPDDLALGCGCHFHWQCLLDSYELSQCPHCGQSLTTTTSTGQQSLVCTLHNEGGFQENLDILPLLTEETYLRVYPEERKCRAFLELCREGDVGAIVDLLSSCNEGDCEADEDDDDDDEDNDMGTRSEKAKVRRTTMDEVLRYQDPIGEYQSGLHAAVAGSSREVVWLLLFLASNLPESEFPALTYQEAAVLGITREDRDERQDIRVLRDVQGRTAEDLAARMGGVWHGWEGTGRLAL
ncbi:hypothetical protein LTR66_006760 [Elasticomyces elasticus]|nr:hypothetical protein LTR66_006760 [Elasticomyces elasticus]KAK5007954.1 hypothetical protein LTR28_004629 [Elasticomyces elasticus]